MAVPPTVTYEPKSRTKQYLCDYLLFNEGELDSIVNWFASRTPIDVVPVGHRMRMHASPQVLATLQSLRDRVSARHLRLVRTVDYISAVEYGNIPTTTFSIDEVDMNNITFISHKWYPDGPDNGSRSLQRHVQAEVSTEWIWIDHLSASSDGAGADLFADVMNGCNLILRGAQWTIHYGPHPHTYMHSAWCTLERLLIQSTRSRSLDVAVFDVYCDCKVRIFEPADWVFILCTLMSTRSSPAESWELLLRNVGANTYARFVHCIREHLTDCGYEAEMLQNPLLEEGIFRITHCLPAPQAERVLLYISSGMRDFGRGIVNECLLDPSLVDIVRKMERQIEHCDVQYCDSTGAFVLIPFEEWKTRHATSCAVQFIGNCAPNSITLPDNWTVFNLLQLSYYAKFAQISCVLPKGPLDHEHNVIWGPSLPTLCHLYCGVLRSNLTECEDIHRIPSCAYFLPYSEDWFIFWVCLAVHCGGFMQAADAILDLYTFSRTNQLAAGLMARKYRIDFRLLTHL